MDHTPHVPDDHKVTTRSRALMAVIEVAASKRAFKIRDVMDHGAFRDEERRTVKRALHDAESGGWIERNSKFIRTYRPGPKLDTLKDGDE